jgi:hypothetical protein
MDGLRSVIGHLRIPAADHFGDTDYPHAEAPGWLHPDGSQREMNKLVPSRSEYPPLAIEFVGKSSLLVLMPAVDV